VSYKRTLVFFAAFAALAAFLYFYEMKGGEARHDAEQKAELLFSFESESIVKMTLRRPDQTIVAEKHDARWEITRPVTAPAEQGTIEQIVKTLADLKYERDLGPQTDLDQFGLVEPEVEVAIDDAQGNIAGLFLGSPTPVGDNIYIKKSDADLVFTIKNLAKKSINKTLVELRDKTVFNFEVPDVKALTVTRDGQTLSFTKGPDGDWIVWQEKEYDVDLGRITAMLDSVKFARIKEFVEEEARDLEEYGLMSPPALIKIQTEEATRILAFGKMPESDSGVVFVQRNESPQVLKLDLDIFEKLSTDINEWRDRRLVKVDRADIIKLHLESPAGKVTLERAEGEPDEWNLTEPERDFADEDAVGSLLADLQDAKVARFLEPEETEKAGSAAKEALIELAIWELGKESPLMLHFFAGESDTEAYATTGEGQELLGVDTQLLQKLTIAPDQIKDKSVLRFNTSDINKIEIGKRDGLFSIEQEGVNWDVPSALEMESFEIDELLWDLGKLKYGSIEPIGEDGEKYGFDPPNLTISLSCAGKKEPLRLTVGNKAGEPGSYYVLGSDDKQVMVVEDVLISQWLERF